MRRPAPNTLDPVAETERFFLQRGIPLFIADYDAETQVWTRALPFLTIVYLASCLPALVHPDARSITGVIVQLALLPIAIGVTNLVAGRPLLSRPRRVGAVHLLVFVLGPLLPFLIDGAWESAVATLAFGVMMLGLTYVVVSYGVIPLLLWVLRRLSESLPDVRNAAVRSLPMILLFVVFMFFGGETWQVFGLLRGWPFVTVQLVFAALGAMFVMTRLRPDAESSERFESWDEVYEHARATPAALLRVDRAVAVTEIPLSKRERRNVLLVVFANQLIMALTIAFVVGLFFMLIGFLAIDAATVKAWVGADPHEIFSLDYRGRRLTLSEEHVRVATFMATFSGFYFAVYSASDPSLRDGLRDDGTTQLRRALAARQIYRTCHQATHHQV